jgi:hypothetical protein
LACNEQAPVAKINTQTRTLRDMRGVPFGNRKENITQ